MKTYRNSLEKHNAPFRGVSSRNDYVNHRMAVTHDLLEIYNVSGGNPLIHGHKQTNEDNLTAIIEGTKNITTDNYTAGVIKNITSERKDLVDLSTWRIPPLTYGVIERVGARGWKLIPPSVDRGFFELDKTLRVKAGDKLMIRFKPKDWKAETVYTFGALNFDSSGHNMKPLKVDENNSFNKVKNSYFEHILRFDEEREVRLAIKTVNSDDGTLSNDPLYMEEFGIYHIEETDVYIRSLDGEIKPMVNGSQMLLEKLERRRI